MIYIVVTRHMLKKKFAQVMNETRSMQYSTRGIDTKQQVLEEDGTVVFSVKKIIGVQGEYMITEDGLKSQLFNPMPCLHWKCLSATGEDGTAKLKTPITGLFVEDGENSYCLGINGASDEFEVRFHVGTNEIRLNNLFLNLTSPHIIINGLEEYTNE